MVKLDLHYKPLFLFYRNLPCLFRPPVYLILPDVPTPCLLGPFLLFILDPRVLVFQNK